MNTNRMETRFNTRISEKLLERLKRKSENEGRNYSEIVRQAIVEYLEKK